MEFDCGIAFPAAFRIHRVYAERADFRILEIRYSSPVKVADGMTRCEPSFATLFKEFRDKAGPASLMTGAESGTVVSMEVFVEQNQVAPVRIILKLL